MAWNISCNVHIKPSCTQVGKKIKTNKNIHQCFFKTRDAEMNKNQEYYNFLHTYCDSGHARDPSDRRSVTSTVHLFNDTLIDWYDWKNMRPLESFPMPKQQQCTQKCKIKIG